MTQVITKKKPKIRPPEHSVTTSGDAFNISTGEVQLLKVVRGKRYAFIGGYRVMSVMYTTKILQSDMSHAEIKVAFWLPTVAKRGNVVIISGKMAEKDLGLERHYFSRLIGQLIKRDYLRREGVRGTYMLNPNFSWNGSVDEHVFAVNAWNKTAIIKTEKKESQAA